MMRIGLTDPFHPQAINGFRSGETPPFPFSSVSANGNPVWFSGVRRKKTEDLMKNRSVSCLAGMDMFAAEHGHLGDGADLGDTALSAGIHRNTAPLNVADFAASEQEREVLIETMRDKSFPGCDDRSMLRKPDMPATLLRSNKYRPLASPADTSDTYEVDFFSLVSDKEIQAVVVQHATSRAKSAPERLNTTVMIRRRASSAEVRLAA
jgi:hypothetical protein